MNTKTSRIVARLALILFIFTQFSGLFLTSPRKAAATLSAVSATLGNSRISFFGKVSGSHTAGTSTILLQNSGNADNNANNIFPGDLVAVGVNGGLTVASRSANLQSIILDQPLTVTVANGTNVYATQSGALTVAFTISQDIPANGYVLITIPANATTPNDGAPDTGASTDVNGFDANGIAATNITTTGGTGCTWDTETWTVSTGGAGHTYKVVTTTACTAGTISVAFATGANALINPAPVTTGHTQGVSDVYPIKVQTYDSGNQMVEDGKTKVAPIEGVFVSATVDETISFTVTAVAANTSTCGQNTSVATTATAVPFGTLSVPNVATASQKLTVSTNADSYIVTIEESAALSVDGLGATTIADTVCDAGSCTHATSGEWKTGYNPAVGMFGYSLANVSGSSAGFLYNESSRVFSAKQVPTTADGVVTIMSANTPVNANSVYVCYMLAIQATQQAGYYWNKVKYTATPTF